MPGNGWCPLALLYSLTYCHNNNPNDGKEINNKFDKNDILRRFGHIQYTIVFPVTLFDESIKMPFGLKGTIHTHVCG